MLDPHPNPRTAILAAIALVLLLSIGGYFLVKVNDGESKDDVVATATPTAKATASATPTPTATATATASPTADPMADWKTYNSSLHGFSFKHSATYGVAFNVQDGGNNTEVSPNALALVPMVNGTFDKVLKSEGCTGNYSLGENDFGGSTLKQLASQAMNTTLDSFTSTALSIGGHDAYHITGTINETEAYSVKGEKVNNYIVTKNKTSYIGIQLCSNGKGTGDELDLIAKSITFN